MTHWITVCPDETSEGQEVQQNSRALCHICSKSFGMKHDGREVYDVNMKVYGDSKKKGSGAAYASVARPTSSSLGS